MFYKICRKDVRCILCEHALLLSVLASFAEEESRSISDNSKWGIRKRFQSGEIGTANKHILGYRYDESLQKYVIIPEEAAIVRRMFKAAPHKARLTALPHIYSPISAIFRKNFLTYVVFPSRGGVTQ
ncbi:MAG: recombinase family protein [Ruminococcus sp.]|nr:recombinase family protein [Ruminococcus sp.]